MDPAIRPSDTRRSDTGLLAIVAGFTLLGASLLAAFLLLQSQRNAEDWVRHTLSVAEQMVSVRSELQSVERDQRSFILSEQPSYAERYGTGRGRLVGSLAALKASIADNPVQLANFNTLSRCVDRRLALLEQGMAFAVTHDRPAALDMLATDPGRPIMDRCLTSVDGMRAEEQRLYVLRSGHARSRSNALLLGLVLSGVATLVLAMLALRDRQRRLAMAVASARALSAANRRLREEAESREAAEKQLRQIQKMESIGQLTGGIAHDFNNMLAIVIGSLDMARRRMTTNPDRALASIDAAAEGAGRAAQLTARLLAFSRQQPLAPEALDINRLVTGMSEMLRRTIGETVRVETVLAGGLWPTFVDAGQFENALLNLCVNARDAMPEGGRLTIETGNAHLDDQYVAENTEAVAGQYVLVSVTDTGMGMPPEVIERAFDPFYTTKGVGKGTGLGLSQVYGFVKQSGGHVKIYSEPGIGTVVKIYMPRHFGPARDDATGLGRTEEPLLQALPGETILVVEDEDRLRQVSVDALRELGYVVVQASSGAEALALLPEQPRVDLLFTDVVMPDMNGRILAERVRDARPGLPVLYTTGYTRNAIVHNGVLDHDVAFLPKPFTVEQLARKIRQVLDAQA